MAKKRTNLPPLKVFGKYLRDLRGRHSRPTICSWLLHQRGVKIDPSTYFQYEEGAVWAPDVAVLMGLSKVHGVPFQGMVDLLLANRANTDAKDYRELRDAIEAKAYDLLRQSTDQGSPSKGGHALDAASARRITELEGELQDLKARWGEVQNVARTLSRIAIGGKEGNQTPRRKAGRG